MGLAILGRPAVFTAALLNSQPLGFYAPAQLVMEARRQCVEVRPVDVNASDWDCTLEPLEEFSPANAQSTSSHARGTVGPQSSLALRLGLRIVHGLRKSSADLIMSTRTSSPFRSLAEVAQRTGLNRTELSLLAKADVFRSLDDSRRTSLWKAMPAREVSPLLAPVEFDEPQPGLPEMTPPQEVVADYETSGLSLRGHPISFLRKDLEQRRVVRTIDLLLLEPERRYRVAGLVLLRQRPSTAKGITFMTIEDETGTANLIVHVNVWERFRPIARRASAIIVHGILQRDNEVIHLLVDQMEDLTALMGEVYLKSRDFR